MKRKNLALLVVNGCLVTIILLWLVVGNLLAAQQEKIINKDWEKFVSLFPQTETNNSALKLEELAAKQGLGPLLVTEKTKKRFPTSQKNQQAFEKIKEELNQYLETQVENPSDKVEVIPESLRRYLASQSAYLEAIRNHVLNSEMLRWEIPDLNEFTTESALPNFSGIFNLQQVLALDILEKNQLGQTTEAYKTLEVLWKINQSMRTRPELLSQLLALIIDNYMAGIARKIDGVSSDWECRIASLIERDSPQSFFISFAGEYLILARTLTSDTWQVVDWYWWNEEPPLYVKIIKPLFQPYLRFSAVGLWQQAKLNIYKFSEQKFCAFYCDNPEKEISLLLWTSISETVFPPLIHYVRLFNRTLINWELTEKVLQVKEIAAQEGSLPQDISGIEESIYKDGKWIYQVESDDTFSLSYSKPPSWWPEQEKGRLILPLTYRGKP
ncbi:MAG: hypothetical protein AB4426_21995 [Xenococcaceae cyanobacterium]